MPASLCAMCEVASVRAIEGRPLLVRVVVVEPLLAAGTNCCPTSALTGPPPAGPRIARPSHRQIPTAHCDLTNHLAGECSILSLMPLLQSHSYECYVSWGGVQTRGSRSGGRQSIRGVGSGVAQYMGRYWLVVDETRGWWWEGNLWCHGQYDDTKYGERCPGCGRNNTSKDSLEQQHEAASKIWKIILLFCT